MNAITLLAQIETRGASVRAEGERLKVRNDNALTDADREAIRAHKSELLALLSAPSFVVPEVASTSREAPGEEAPALVENPGLDFCARRRVWLRRVGGAVWIVPTRATLGAYADLKDWRALGACADSEEVTA